jgi:peptide chain release factor 2
MQPNEIKQTFLDIKTKHQEIFSMIDFHQLQKDVTELDQKTYDQAFWNDSEEANKIIKKLKELKSKKDKLDQFAYVFEELEVLYEFIQSGEDMIADFEKNVSSFYKQFDALSVALLLQDENDKLNAIMEIHPGAGGTESQDWADMLYRMYKRFAETNDYQFELLDYLAGDEAGIKSVTFSLKQENAFGYLKCEQGVHRLVRISPFDSNGRRHTSFASVTVIPELDDTIDIHLEDKDLKIDTYRSSGAGGQSVNTTDSAVRITHLPTNTVVTVQNERSQIKNRDVAMQILKGKLYMMELEKKQQELSSYRGSEANSFGSQIRSYVMHPYAMVKDHRTNHETGNVAKVLDGDVQPFIDAYLKFLARGE